MADAAQNKEQDDGLLGWLSSSFQSVAEDASSWLQRQFHKVTPSNLVQEAAESLLGDNIVRSILSLAIEWMDKDKTTLDDDSAFLTGLKRWHAEVDGEIAEKEAEQAAEAAKEATAAETAPGEKQGWIPDFIPLIPKAW